MKYDDLTKYDESKMAKNHHTSSDCHMTLKLYDEKKVGWTVFFFTKWKCDENHIIMKSHMIILCIRQNPMKVIWLFIHVTKSDEKSYDFSRIWQSLMNCHMIFHPSYIIRWKVIWLFIHITKSDEKSDDSIIMKYARCTRRQVRSHDSHECLCLNFFFGTQQKK